GLWDDTAIIFMSDHGFYHGEHGLIGKSLITPSAQGLTPLYDEVAHIPLIIRVPGITPRKCEALAQPPDLMPTILELAETKVPQTVQGSSLLPFLEGKNPVWRDFAVTSPSIIHGPVAGQRISVITKEWFFIYCGQIDEALRELLIERKIKIVDGFERLQKILGEKPRNELYYLPKDSTQQKNVFDENKGVAGQIHEKLVKFLKALNTEEKVLRYWKKMV
ncbi:sulfatase-like hydrolase/transferase, partial [Candidatus Bathyarchaeota archaeon]|nr:sulfatase-like hydrolase/transferase [Candidatus Bathyarchaeota archaeon]